MMKTIKQIRESDSRGGSIAGKMELRSTSVGKAYSFAKSQYEKHGRDIDKEVPDFKENYKHAQSMASLGHTKRKDMPVISADDILHLQKMLMDGMIDVSEPFSKTTDIKKVLSSGLSIEDARRFLKAGSKEYDGDEHDDKVRSKITMVEVGKLKPIQEQIYVDKPILKQVKETHKQTVKYLKNAVFVVSNDGYIIDGHHRYMSALIIDRKMKVRILEIDMNKEKLVKIALAYSDGIGNKRNK